MREALKTLGESALRRFGLEVRRLQKPGSCRRKWLDESAGKMPTVFRLEEGRHLEAEEFTRWSCP